MTDIDLGKRAVACPGWRWMPGMHDTLGDIVVHVQVHVQPRGPLFYDPADDQVPFLSLNRLPDLTDPATLGCLLALVREAWGDPAAACVPWYGPRNVVAVFATHPEQPRMRANVAQRATEAEALVAALEAAPRGEP